MTAIDELCRLLDERGVKYSHEDVTGGTLFVVTRDVRIYYILAREKGFEVWSDWLTPEQAVAATLGPATCHLEEIEKDCDTASEYMLDREWCFDAVYRCSCGCRFGHVAHNRPRFCPNCGAKAVGE